MLKVAQLVDHNLTGPETDLLNVCYGQIKLEGRRHRT